MPSSDFIYTNILSLPVNVNVAGDSIVIPAVPGKLISVVRLFLVIGGITSVTFKDGPNPQSGPLPMVANATFVLDMAKDRPWFQTTSVLNNLVLNSSVAVQISGVIYYTQG